MRGTETVLPIDDEEMIRILGRRILQEYGYTVLLANDGEEGLNLYLRERGQIDLIILDLSVPRLPGREFLERLYAMDPKAKVLVSSGYAEAEQAQLLKQFRAVAYINKPCEPPELARRVRNVLDGCRET